MLSYLSHNTLLYSWATIDKRGLLAEYYKLPKEDALLDVHVDCINKGLLYQDSDDIPIPNDPKVAMHIMYPGTRMPKSNLPKGVERIMVAEHFSQECKSAHGELKLAESLLLSRLPGELKSAYAFLYSLHILH